MIPNRKAGLGLSSPAGKVEECRGLQGPQPEAGRCIISIVYLIRHGETPWNAERRIQGGVDIPLNDRGRLQAEALARRLAAIPLARIYTSDLARARETTAIIQARQPRDIPVVATPGLRECRYGPLGGADPWEVVVGRFFPGEWKGWLKGGGIACLPRGGLRHPGPADRGGLLPQLPEEGPVLTPPHHGAVQAILCHTWGSNWPSAGPLLPGPTAPYRPSNVSDLSSGSSCSTIPATLADLASHGARSSHLVIREGAAGLRTRQRSPPPSVTPSARSPGLGRSLRGVLEMADEIVHRFVRGEPILLLQWR
jgi:hypothetical protein